MLRNVLSWQCEVQALRGGAPSCIRQASFGIVSLPVSRRMRIAG
jgi:hypothetical protein